MKFLFLVMMLNASQMMATTVSSTEKFKIAGTQKIVLAMDLKDGDVILVEEDGTEKVFIINEVLLTNDTVTFSQKLFQPSYHYYFDLVRQELQDAEYFSLENVRNEVTQVMAHAFLGRIFWDRGENKMSDIVKLYGCESALGAAFGASLGLSAAMICCKYGKADTEKVQKYSKVAGTVASILIPVAATYYCLN